jgi:Ca2+-binding EF-hand superfamily protein
VLYRTSIVAYDKNPSILSTRMGQGSGKRQLTSSEMRELVTKAKYMDKKELNQWYNDFMTDCPDGHLRKEVFCNVYQQWFPCGDASVFAGFMFDAFDANRSGFIEFPEFVHAVSITSRGTMDEKLNWAFRLYDRDADGFISKQDMFVMVSAIYKMIGTMLDMPVDEDTPEKRVDKVFKQMDFNQDDRLSKDEFIEGSKMDPWVVQSLNMNFADGGKSLLSSASGDQQASPWSLHAVPGYVPKLSGHLRLHRDKDTFVAATFSASHRGLPLSSLILE